MPLQHVGEAREPAVRDLDVRAREWERGRDQQSRVLALRQGLDAGGDRDACAVEADLDGQPAVRGLADLLHPHCRWLATGNAGDFLQFLAGLPVAGAEDVARHSAQAPTPNRTGRDGTATPAPTAVATRSSPMSTSSSASGSSFSSLGVAVGP